MSRCDVLLIVHDLQFGAPLHAALEHTGHHVRRAASVLHGLTLAREVLPRVVLVERELPDGSGRDVITRLRRSSPVPILVLTAQDIVEETVDLLALGADDVLIKPVAVRETVARIGVQLRRSRSHHEEQLQYRDLVVWPQQHQVTVRGEALPLTATERKILVTLLRRQGHIWSHADLAHEVWAGTALPRDSNVLVVHLNNLRAKLKTVDLQGVIHTVRHVGYGIRSETERDLREHAGAKGRAVGKVDSPFLRSAVILRAR
ncbi:response regulator transcription factor [Deinococcus ruber]|uniref:DNA-binding response regulator n=1 Tax=Deinococcus ruber TaxID=1848197 RepID=A0A918CER2_9DEIO|nr:response regulator transcription factor [Deinococcus ruber]GGR17517.1 DNA-binding response regulator [Deinococcus ruber]